VSVPPAPAPAPAAAPAPRPRRTTRRTGSDDAGA
jgi:hypothetical protein